MKILSIDQSTSGTKAMLFDERGELLFRYDLPHRQIIDSNGWVEHDPEEIIKNVNESVRQLIGQNQIDEDEIAAVGLSNQRETVVAWKRSDGKALYNAIVWQCPRAKVICSRIGDKSAKQIKETTGMTLSPYFSGPKAAWMIENLPEVKIAADTGDLLIGTIDAWLVFNLTDNHVYKTDYSNASRTQLFDIHSLNWSKEVCRLFRVPVESLPEVVDSNSSFGETDFGGVLKRKIPILGVLGDSHAALFAQGCHRPGMAKATYGTGSSVMMNTGNHICDSKSGIVTSLAWGIDGKIDYVLEGNINYTGAVTGWLIDKVGLLSDAKEAGKIAATANPEDRTYLVPAFTGLGAPYWDPDASAAIVGMGRTTGRAEIVKAAEECIAYQIADIVKIMKTELQCASIEKLSADGGPTKDNFLMQFQSDILGMEVTASNISELSGAGVAYLAGKTAGVFDLELICKTRKTTTFFPKKDEQWREEKYRGWKDAVNRVLSKK